MTSPSRTRVNHVRYIGVAAPDFNQQVNFYAGLWGLNTVGVDGDVAYFAAEGSPEQYVYRVRQAEDRRVDLVAFAVDDAAAVHALAAELANDGVHLAAQPDRLQTPGGGYGFRFFDPDGRTVEISADVEMRPFRVLEARESIPRKLSHVVLNSPDPERCMAFYTDKLGFKVSGWLENWFGFLRCTPDFHSLAFVRAPHANLNHVSFEMRGYDEYMRGVGRALQGGVPMYRGIGKHTPADSTFAYFRDPSGFTSEYSAPQEMIVDDEAYQPRTWLNSENKDEWGTSFSRNLPEDTTLARSNGPVDPGLWIAPPV
jgi:catechol 2,3-dioxygenase-like lactoylglutathione lyase family enzyme